MIDCILVVHKKKKNMIYLQVFIAFKHACVFPNIMNVVLLLCKYTMWGIHEQQ